MSDLTAFSEWLQDHARGTVDEEMTAALAEIIQAVQSTGKKGAVVLEVRIALAGNIGTRTVMTSCKVTPKPPTPDPEQSVFFIGEGGSLHRDDPYQGRMIDKTTGEVLTPT